MNIIRKIPLPIRPILEDVLKDEYNNFKVVDNGESGFKIIEKNDNSEFSFSYIRPLTKEVQKFHLTAYSFSIFPISDNLENETINLTGSEVEDKLNEWIKRVKKFHVTSPLFDDDPILNHYMEEQESIFESTDEDADFTPLSYPRQKALHNVYEQLIKEMLKENEQSPKLKAYIQDLKENQASIGSDTKNEAVSKFSRNVAKARKLGVAVFEKVLAKLAAEGVIAIWPKVAGFTQALLNAG